MGDRRVGELGRTANTARIYYASTSRRLAEDVARLLLRFGVLTRLKRPRKGGLPDCWHLHISGVENQTTFLRQIGVHGRAARRPSRC